MINGKREGLQDCFREEISICDDRLAFEAFLSLISFIINLHFKFLCFLIIKIQGFIIIIIFLDSFYTFFFIFIFNLEFLHYFIHFNNFQFI